MSNFWRPSAPWKPVKSGYEVNLSVIQPFMRDDTVPAPGIGYTPLSQFKETRGSDGSILYQQFTRVGPGVNKTTFTIWNK